MILWVFSNSFKASFMNNVRTRGGKATKVDENVAKWTKICRSTVWLWGISHCRADTSTTYVVIIITKMKMWHSFSFVFLYSRLETKLWTRPYHDRRVIADSWKSDTWQCRDKKCLSNGTSKFLLLDSTSLAKIVKVRNKCVSIRW